MRLRIAMVGACPYPAPYGSQVLLRSTAECLHHLGHEVHMVVYGFGVGSVKEEFQVHRAARVPFGSQTTPGPSFMKPLQDIALAAKLRRVVRDNHIDVICAHNYEALLAALLAGKRPILYFAHNAMAEELPQFMGNEWLTGGIGRFLDRQFPRRADKIIAPHYRLAGHLVIRGCSQDQVIVVPPSMNAELFEPPSVQAHVMPPVVYAGNVDPYQNLPLLIAAMKKVRQKQTGIKLLVGTAARTHIPGAEMVHIPDIQALLHFMAQDLVFAVPRVTWSGYPMKILNAMAAGKAVVACESAAYPLTHEETGWFVPDNDADAYAEALIRLIEEPHLREKLGTHARQVILEHHKPEAVAQQLASIAEEAYDRYNTRVRISKMSENHP